MFVNLEVWKTSMCAIRRLQNGKFDAPDRLFLSIEKSYKSATSNPADVKELIPEFYLTDSRYQTYIIKEGLPCWKRSPAFAYPGIRLSLSKQWVARNLHCSQELSAPSESSLKLLSLA